MEGMQEMLKQKMMNVTKISMRWMKCM